MARDAMMVVEENQPQASTTRQMGGCKSGKAIAAGDVSTPCLESGLLRAILCHCLRWLEQIQNAPESLCLSALPGPCGQTGRPASVGVWACLGGRSKRWLAHA
eukprot:1846842-Pleurochrysis_carterae.AAC.1